MFGRNIFPRTRWDNILNTWHTLPDYQPFEYLVAGKYISEIVRLIVIEATQTAGLFDGNLPPSLRTPYSLDTKDLAQIDDGGLGASCSLLHRRHPSPHFPSERDITFIKNVVRFVSVRSIAYFTVGMHALTTLIQWVETKPEENITIGCDGSVINEYPGYMERAQGTLNQMIQSDNLHRTIKVKLVRTFDSAVLGAAVAAAMAANVDDADGMAS